MRKQYPAAIVVSLLCASCATPYSDPELQANQRITVEAITKANVMLNDEHKQECVDRFRATTHDPSSFELAGRFSVNQWRTHMANQLARRERGDLPDGIVEIVYSVPVRAKNRMGALILSSMDCFYNFIDVGPAPQVEPILMFRRAAQSVGTR